MGLLSKIGNLASGAFKAGKKFVGDHSNVIGAGLTAINPVAGAAYGVANSKFGRGALGKLWNAGKGVASTAWEGIKKGYQQGKELASKHADTIGSYAAGALSAYSPTLGAAASLIGKHFANDNTGWGRFAKGLSSGLSSKLQSQSNASNESNGHVASGYSISSNGNYNGMSRKRSNAL